MHVSMQMYDILKQVIACLVFLVLRSIVMYLHSALGEKEGNTIQEPAGVVTIMYLKYTSCNQC